MNALRALKNIHPDLYKILGRVKNTEHIGYFVKDPDRVFIKSPELVTKEGSIAKLGDGWYTTTILSNHDKEDILIYACSVAKIEYLDEMEIWFGGGKNNYTPLSKEESEQSLNKLLGL